MLTDFNSGKFSERNQHICPISSICFFASDCMSKKTNNFKKLIKFNKDDIISSDYEKEKCMYIIVSGIGIAKCYLESGEEITICLVGKGQTFGEGFPVNGGYPITLQALTEITVCQLSENLLLNSGPGMLNNILHAGLINYRAISRQVWIMNAQRIYERIKRTLIVLAELHDWDSNKIPLIISHADLALLINTDRPSVTRALHRLEKEGFIELGYQHLSINNPITFCTIEDLFQTNPSRQIYR